MMRQKFFGISLAMLLALSAPLMAEDIIDIYDKAQSGDAQAQCELGERYMRGQGLRQDSTKARQWLEKAAAQGPERAAILLNTLKQPATSAPASPSQSAEDLYQKALRCENPAKAAEFFLSAAKQGLALAQYSLGGCYANGQGVPQSYEEAAKWFKLAAEQGDALAQSNLGFRYANGQDVPQSYTEAAKWFKLAADQGLALAQFSLGVCYADGQGVPQSYEEAAKWFMLAAEQGLAEAQNNLGFCYASGQGVPQSYEEASKWFMLAADQGLASAQYILGLFYIDGIGVKKNRAEGIRLLRQAHANGNSEAAKALKDLGETP